MLLDPLPTRVLARLGESPCVDLASLGLALQYDGARCRGRCRLGRLPAQPRDALFAADHRLFRRLGLVGGERRCDRRGLATDGDQRLQRRRAARRREPTFAAQEAWGEELARTAAGLLRLEVENCMVHVCDDGTRAFMPYTGGLDRFDAICREVAADGYRRRRDDARQEAVA